MISEWLLIKVFFTACHQSWGKVSLVSVCLFTRGPRVTIIDDALDLPVQGPLGHQTGDPSPGPIDNDIWWPSLDTCSNFFTRGPPNPSIHLVPKACTVGKQAVCILLECFLFILIFFVVLLVELDGFSNSKWGKLNCHHPRQEFQGCRSGTVIAQLCRRAVSWLGIIIIIFFLLQLRINNLCK